MRFSNCQIEAMVKKVFGLVGGTLSGKARLREM